MSENIIKLITYKKPNAIVVGSQRDDLVKYKNDTDIFETVIFHNNKKDFIEEVYKMIETIIKHIKTNENIYFMEFKAGIYEPLYISDEDILNKTKRNNFYKKALKANIIDKDIYETIQDLDNNSLIYFCSNLYKVRWSIKDLENKYVKLFNDYRYNFEEIFNEKSTIKLDIFYYENNLFNPYSNMFRVINNNMILTEEQDDIKKSLEYDITNLIKENKYYKAIKRLYSISKMDDNKDLKEKLLKIINSPAGNLYQTKGFIENCEEILYKYHDKNTINKVKESLREIKESHVLSKRLENLLTKSLNKKTIKTLIKSLIKITEIMDKEITRKTLKLIEKFDIKI